MSEQIIDTRIDMYMLGVDTGSDAKVLVASGLLRLVWSKAHSRAYGMRGMGSVAEPGCLEARRFELKDGRLNWRGSTDLLSGGRPSRKNLMSAAEAINALFGPGVAERIDPKKTLVLQEDLVSKALSEMRERAAAEASKNSEKAKAWLDSAEHHLTSDGELLGPRGGPAKSPSSGRGN